MNPGSGPVNHVERIVLRSLMTKLLEKALHEVAKLPESEQDAVAAILLEELASEHRWAESFGKSQKQLAKLAAEALAEYNAGRTKPL